MRNHTKETLKIHQKWRKNKGNLLTLLQPAGKPGRVYRPAGGWAGLREPHHRPQGAGHPQGLDEGGRTHGRPGGRHRRLLHLPQGLRLPGYVVKGTLSRDFWLEAFFSSISFPQASCYPKRAILNFSKNLRRFLHHHVNDTGGKTGGNQRHRRYRWQSLPLVSLISVVNLDLQISPRIFQKFEINLMLYMGLQGEDDSWKKTWSKNRVTLSF